MTEPGTFRWEPAALALWESWKFFLGTGVMPGKWSTADLLALEELGHELARVKGGA